MIGGFVHVVTPQNKATNANCNSLTQNVTLARIVTPFDAKCNDFFNSSSNMISIIISILLDLLETGLSLKLFRFVWKSQVPLREMLVFVIPSPCLSIRAFMTDSN